MAIKNHKTGKYEVSKFIKATGKVLVGEGNTKEEANENLRDKKKAYYNNPVIKTENEIRSPGYRYFKDTKDNIHSEFSSNYKENTLARPEIAEEIKNNKK